MVCGVFIVKILMVDMRYWKMRMCFGKLGLGSVLEGVVGFLEEEREVEFLRFLLSRRARYMLCGGIGLTFRREMGGDYVREI